MSADREKLICMATDREKVARLMLRHSIATGHGDTIDDLLATLSAALDEMRAAMSAERDLAEAILVELLSGESIQTAADLFDVLVKSHPDWGSHICMRTVVTAVYIEAVDRVLARRQSEAARSGPWDGGHHFQEEDGYPGSLVPRKRGAP